MEGVAERIVKNLSREGKEKDELICKFKKEIKERKKLTRESFDALKKLVKENKLLEFIQAIGVLNMKESIVVGRAIMQTKVPDINSLVYFFIDRKSESSVVILTCLMCKKCRFDTSAVIGFIQPFIKEEKCSLACLRFLLVLYRNYKECFDEELMEFCRKNNHPVCVEIMTSEKSQKK
jgi:hypothetical protein